MTAATFRRVTVGEVQAAREATGLRITTGLTIDADEGCGCPIGVLAWAADHARVRAIEDQDIDSVGAVAGLDANYCNIFAVAFDDARMAPWAGPGDVLAHAAHADGMACRRAFLESGEL